MAVRPLSTSPRSRSQPAWVWAWLDTAAILAWGGLLLKYGYTGQLSLLLHENYRWLAYAAGYALLGLGGWKLGQLRRKSQTRSTHTTRVAPGWSVLLLLVALLGFWFTPRPFASEVALNRGVTDTISMTRSQPQSFRGSVPPEQRSVIDWRRTFDVYPEPDAYVGQKVNVDGFVIHPPNFPNNYFLLARFVITCCAADAYPVGLPVKVEGDRSAYAPDKWLRVEGSLITETIDNLRQSVISATKFEPIPEPADPYDT